MGHVDSAARSRLAAKAAAATGLVNFAATERSSHVIRSTTVDEADMSLSPILQGRTFGRSCSAGDREWDGPERLIDDEDDSAVGRVDGEVAGAREGSVGVDAGDW